MPARRRPRGARRSTRASGRCLAGLPVAAASSGRVGWCGPDYERSAVPSVRVILGVNKFPSRPPPPYPFLPTPSCSRPPRVRAGWQWRPPAVRCPPVPPSTPAQRLSRGGGSCADGQLRSVRLMRLRPLDGPLSDHYSVLHRAAEGAAEGMVPQRTHTTRALSLKTQDAARGWFLTRPSARRRLPHLSARRFPARRLPRRLPPRPAASRSAASLASRPAASRPAASHASRRIRVAELGGVPAEPTATGATPRLSGPVGRPEHHRWREGGRKIEATANARGE